LNTKNSNKNQCDNKALLESYPEFCCVSNNQIYIAECTGNKVNIWESSSIKHLGTLEGHKATITYCCFSPNDEYIVSGSEDKTLKIWSSKNYKELIVLNGHTDSIKYCDFFSDGKRILSASNDSTLKIWNANNGKEIHTLKGHTMAVTICSISPDEKLIYSASYDNTLKLWDAIKCNELYSIKSEDGFCCCRATEKNIFIIDNYLQLKAYDKNNFNSVSLQSPPKTNDNIYVHLISNEKWIGAFSFPEKILYIWEISTFKLVWVLHDVCCANFLGANKIVLFNAVSYSLIVYNIILN